MGSGDRPPDGGSRGGSGGGSPGRPPSRGRPSRSGDAPETESERRLINIVIVGFVLGVIGLGLWLGDAMLEARRMDECVSSGRRNCAPITVPPAPVR
jgi:hypothetical protein